MTTEFTKILFLEDDPDLRETLTSILLGEGYDVYAATNAADALRELNALPDSYYLLATDLTMPEMHGTEVAARMLRIQPKLKVLFMSGNFDDTVGQMHFPPNQVYQLSKPFSAPEFLHMVDSIRSNKTARRRAR